MTYLRDFIAKFRINADSMTSAQYQAAIQNMSNWTLTDTNKKIVVKVTSKRIEHGITQVMTPRAALTKFGNRVVRKYSEGHQCKHFEIC